MLSDIENRYIKLGGENHFDTVEREESLNSNLARRPESANSNNFENDDETTYLNSGVINPCIYAEYGRNSASANSSAEINRFSSELNSRISREKDELMNSVSIQIQKAINDDIGNQILPQIQNVIMAGSGHVTKKRWNVPAEGPETNTEILRNEKARKNSKSELVENLLNDGATDNAHDTIGILFQFNL